MYISAGVSNNAGEVRTYTNAPLHVRFDAAYLQVFYDEVAETVAIKFRRGEPKYVVVGRGSFVLYADDFGLWGVDLEVKEWEGGDRELFLSLKGRVWSSP